MTLWCAIVQHLTVTSTLFLVTSGYTQPTNRPKRIDDLVLPKVYSMHDPPLRDGVTDVSIGIYINSFYAISEQTMDYSLSLYLRQSWSDPRLAYIPADNKTGKVKLEAAWNKMWVPDTFFRNEKKSGFHSVTVDNRMATVSPDGAVWYVIKISSTLSCPMTLHKYPMDTQVCPLMFESFGYTVDTIRLVWMESPVDTPEDMELAQFTYEGHQLRDCSQNYTSGASPCLEMLFTLRRDIGYFMIQVYVPSILIVILSWVSFWISVDAAPARVSLGLLTVLTTATQSSGINTSLPRVSYIKAIDVWMSVCLLFVFTALLEYAFVNASMRDKESRKHGRQIVAAATPTRLTPSSNHQRLQYFDTKGQPRDQVDRKQTNECSNCIPMSSHRPDREESAGGSGGGGGGGILASVALPPKPTKVIDTDGKARARGIDKIARKSFPLAFILFNVVYWVGYTYESK